MNRSQMKTYPVNHFSQAFYVTLKTSHEERDNKK